MTTTKPYAKTNSRIGRRRFLLQVCGWGGAGMLLGGRAFAAATVEKTDLKFFRIGTGATSGTYFPLGGMMASALSNPPGARECARGGSCGVPGVIVVAQATQGSVENVESVHNGLLESALCQADVSAWAYGGTNQFERRGAMDDIRSLANLYSESLHVVVAADSAIRTIKDLKGKRVCMGEPESGTLVDARLALGTGGLTEKDVKPFFIKLSTASEQLRLGQLDAFFQIGGYPVSAIMELAEVFPVRLVPIPVDAIERLRKRVGFFAVDHIPANLYPGVGEETPTIGIGAQWITSSRVDDEFAYQLVKSLWHPNSQHLMASGHPIGKRIAFAHALDGLGAPLHPGAERFYREMGLIPDKATGQ